MCGFFGWLCGNRVLSEKELGESRAALRTLAHRGPDGEADWHDEKIFLGHRRLVIIDKSAAANQPFSDPSGRYILVFNGEIYNYVELRASLTKAGIVFQTQSDTEVLLHVLVSSGVNEGLRLLDGMFAGALYDRETGSLHIFRDHLGQKPLYYFWGDGELLIASELRAILSLPTRDWRIDRDAFRRYVAASYYPWHYTPVEGIRKLLPGTVGAYVNGTFSVSRWWDSVPGNSEMEISDAQALDDFEDVFDSACGVTMRSDVPVGLFLSGGIDSSLIASSCKKLGFDLATYHVSMSEADYDESSKALRVARHLGITRETQIDMNPQRTMESFGEIMERMDEPHGDPGYINAYRLSKESRPEITVALAGDGADELFAGYLPFKAIRYAPPPNLLPTPLVEAMIWGLGQFPSSDTYLGFNMKLRAFLQGLLAKNSPMIGLWLATAPPQELSALLSAGGRDFFDPNSSENVFMPDKTLDAQMDGLNRFNAQLYFYQKIFLPEFVCHHTDRAGMLNGLEIRSPFLTKRVIEFANRLPARFKMRGGGLKWALKEVLKRRGFPEDIVSQKKQGFTLPVARFLKGGMKNYVDDLLNNVDAFAGEISATDLNRLVDEHLQGRHNHYRLIYNLIVFLAWRKRHPQLRFA